MGTPGSHQQSVVTSFLDPKPLSELTSGERVEVLSRAIKVAVSWGDKSPGFKSITKRQLKGCNIPCIATRETYPEGIFNHHHWMHLATIEEKFLGLDPLAPPDKALEQYEIESLMLHINGALLIDTVRLQKPLEMFGPEDGEMLKADVRLMVDEAIPLLLMSKPDVLREALEKMLGVTYGKHRDTEQVAANAMMLFQDMRAITGRVDF